MVSAAPGPAAPQDMPPAGSRAALGGLERCSRCWQSSGRRGAGSRAQRRPPCSAPIHAGLQHRTEAAVPPPPARRHPRARRSRRRPPP